MQKGFSLRAVVDKRGIPLTTLRNYRNRSIISPDVADKSGKFTLYSDAQIEIAKAYRSEHPPKNDKNQDAGANYTTPAVSKNASKKAYLVNPPESLGVKFNRLNVYLGDNGAFEVDAHFDTTHIETAYRRFVDIFLQAAADIPALNGYDHFPPAKKLIQNVNGWENEFGEQIFFKEANDCLCIDINENTVYIFGKFNQYTTAPVAKSQPDVNAEPNDDAISSIAQPVALPINFESNISVGEEITLAQRAEHIRSLQADIQRGIIQIGFELIVAKKHVDHGNWQSWLADEFHWTIRTAQNFMAIAERFGKNENFFVFQPSTLIQMLALPKGTEQEFIDAQAAAGMPVETQSVREIKRNIKAFKQQRTSRKNSVDDKLPMLQGLSLTLDVPNESPVTTETELVDKLHTARANIPAEETDDLPAIIDRDNDSDIVATLAQVTAVNALIAKTNDLRQLREIRISLAETLASLDAKLDALAQKN